MAFTHYTGWIRFARFCADLHSTGCIGAYYQPDESGLFRTYRDVVSRNVFTTYSRPRDWNELVVIAGYAPRFVDGRLVRTIADLV